MNKPQRRRFWLRIMLCHLTFIKLFITVTVWTSVQDPTPSNKAQWNCIDKIIWHFTALDRPPHSKHLAPYDFCPFPKLKNTGVNITSWMMMMPWQQWSTSSVNTMQNSIMTASWKYMKTEESVLNREVIKFMKTVPNTQLHLLFGKYKLLHNNNSHVTYLRNVTACFSYLLQPLSSHSWYIMLEHYKWMPILNTIVAYYTCHAELILFTLILYTMNFINGCRLYCYCIIMFTFWTVNTAVCLVLFCYI